MRATARQPESGDNATLAAPLSRRPQQDRERESPHALPIDVVGPTMMALPRTLPVAIPPPSYAPPPPSFTPPGMSSQHPHAGHPSTAPMGAPPMPHEGARSSARAIIYVSLVLIVVCAAMGSYVLWRASAGMPP
jgi:hypothetical protein